jgi:hypothetical protein
VSEPGVCMCSSSPSAEVLAVVPMFGPGDVVAAIELAVEGLGP